MVPAGHTPLNLTDTAAAQGLTPAQWRRRGGQHQPGHPEPLNPHRQRRRLWSAEEVHAYTRGEHPAPRSEHEHPDDLLDSAEARHLFGGLTESPWWTRIRSGTAPPPDTHLYGEPYWHRHTINTWRDHPATRHGAGGPGRGGGRKPGQHIGPYTRAQARRRHVAAILTQHPDTSTTHLAHQLGVSPRTIERDRRAQQQENSPGKQEQ